MVRGGFKRGVRQINPRGRGGAVEGGDGGQEWAVEYREGDGHQRREADKP